MTEEEGSGSEVPEVSDPRHHLVASGETVDFEYEVGSFVSADPSCTTAIILVAEVDSRLLVALPEGAWHRKRAKRSIAPNSISKAVQVAIVPASAANREQPQGSATLKIWLGLLSSEFEGQLAFPAGDDMDIAFPIGANGEPFLPYAAALVAVAKDHFTFFSAESGVPQPPGLGVPGLDQRVTAMEGALGDIQKSLAQLLGKGGHQPEKQNVLVARPKPSAQARLPQNVDPGVAAQALQAGVSPAALAEISAALGLPAAATANAVQPEAVADSSEEEEHAVDGGGGDTGSTDPMVQALVKLTTKKEEGQNHRPHPGSRRVWISWPYIEQFQNQGFRSQDVARIVGQGSEADLSISGATSSSRLGTGGSSTITARGWLEHRSRIQAFPSAIRPAWMIAGIWDSLRQNKPEEARARAGLSLAMLDQQGCDAGGWLIASELALEPAPPYSSFSSHVPPSSWETPHTKLIDSRFFDLVVSKLKDLADFQDKKHRLGGGGGARKSEEDQPKPTPKAKGDPKKGAGKGKKGGDAREAEPPPASQ